MLLRTLGILTLFVSAASAQEVPCAPTEAMIGHIEKRYNEGAAFEGIVGDKTRMVLFVNGESRTWSVLVIRSDGKSCLLLSGNEGDVVHPGKASGDPT